MFGVTLINLSRDASSALEGNAPIELGMIDKGRLTALLDTFAALDAVQNLKLDPEIRVQTKRDRFIVRTGEGKFFLYDARHPSDAAHVCDSPAEIIAEMDGSAAALRTVTPFKIEPATDRYGKPDDGPKIDENVAIKEPPSKTPTVVLAGIALILSGYIAYAEFSAAESDATPALTMLTASEFARQDAALVGVYMTGSLPGNCGIVVQGDRSLKIFRVNHQSAPSTAHGTYRLGRIESALYLATDQPGGLIKVLDTRTLEYCGERYERIQ